MSFAGKNDLIRYANNWALHNLKAELVSLSADNERKTYIEMAKELRGRISITREGAEFLMQIGFRVTHKNFTSEEWCYGIFKRSHGLLHRKFITEDGCDFTERFKTDSMFDDGWRIFDES